MTEFLQHNVDDFLKEDILDGIFCLGYLKMYLQKKHQKRMVGFFFNLKVCKSLLFQTFYLFISETEIKKTSANVKTN